MTRTIYDAKTRCLLPISVERYTVQSLGLQIWNSKTWHKYYIEPYVLKSKQTQHTQYPQMKRPQVRLHIQKGYVEEDLNSKWG